MTLLKELNERGLIAQITHPEAIEKLLNNEKVTFYIGFDATADSLHIGHFIQIIVMKHFQNVGHRAIALLGTGTTLVGDPTGKTDMRKMMSVDEINANADQFKRQIGKYVDIEEKGICLKNGDWLLDKQYIDFLREIGVHYSVNRMLSAECFKSRLEKGLSFIEFNYMIMQGYDFLHLNQQEDCILELGGDDQWSNILSGIDLIRRVEGKEAYGITFKLLTTKDGKKMGKTENGAVWLDKNKFSAYDFYQYFRNIDDEEVIKCMKMLTFIDLCDIMDYEQKLLKGEININQVKERTAYEITKIVHGEESAMESMLTARELFKGSKDSVNMPKKQIGEKIFEGIGIGIIDLLVYIDICKTKSEARRLIDQGGILLDNEKITDPTFKINKSKMSNGYIVIRKGKKTYVKVEIVD